MRREREKTEMKDGELIIVRTFHAARELVFKAFTEKKHLEQWWGPVGFRLKVLGLEVRPGGFFHYSMTSAQGMVMWGRLEYCEIDAPGKIIFTSSFADEKGNITRAPFSPDFPLRLLNTWTFEETGGETTLTLRGKPLEVTEEEQKTFEKLFASMREGYGKTFDALVEYLASVPK